MKPVAITSTLHFRGNENTHVDDAVAGKQGAAGDAGGGVEAQVLATALCEV